MIENILLGASLGLDASVVSLTDGLVIKSNAKGKIFFICFCFGLFQFLMPFLGYLIGIMFKDLFIHIIPIFSFLLFFYLGINMIKESFKKDFVDLNISINYKDILFQGVATSIDAFLVGITFINYNYVNSIFIFFIFGLITFFMCIIAIKLGNKFGLFLKEKANLLGGIILLSLSIKTIVIYIISTLL